MTEERDEGTPADGSPTTPEEGPVEKPAADEPAGTTPSTEEEPERASAASKNGDATTPGEGSGPDRDEATGPRTGSADDAASPAGGPGNSLVPTGGDRSWSTDDSAAERSGPSWLIPAATFVVGLLLGGGVIFATTSADSDGVTTDAASPTATSSSSPTVSSSVPADRTITVPGECLALADESQKVLDLVDQAVASARDLDASGLSDVVRELQQSRDSLESNTQACRSSVEVSPAP